MNRSKAKGDRNERAAVVVIAQLAGPAALAAPRRKLGAGRRDDMGDLDVLPGVCIQVRALADVSTALRSAAADAAVQAERSGDPWCVGVVPLPRARSVAVRWLAAAYRWPSEVPPDAVARFGTTAAAVEHVRDERIGVPRTRRVALVERSGQRGLWLGPIEAWVSAWKQESQCV